jgi:hypothetical protein
MKVKKLVCLCLVCVAACIDEIEPFPAEFNDYAGIWVPYQMIYPDGTTFTGPFTNATIFGIYAESVELHQGNTYTPVIWTNSDTYSLKENEAGNIEYRANGKRLIFTGGAIELEFEVTSYYGDELTLQYMGTLSILGGSQATYFLKREIKK